MANLVLLAGVPGCGKTTWAKMLLAGKYSIISSDDIRKNLAGSLKDAHGQDIRPWDVFYQKIGEGLSHDIDVVADATFLTVNHRDRAREVAKGNLADLHLVIFKNWLQANFRNGDRDVDAKVPDNVMADMMKLYWDTLARIPQEEYASVTKIESF